MIKVDYTARFLFYACVCAVVIGFIMLAFGQDNSQDAQWGIVVLINSIAAWLNRRHR